MIKYSLTFTTLLVMLVSCKKAETVVSSEIIESSVSLTNANASSKSVNFFINGTQKTTTAVATNGTITGTYVGLGDATTTTIVAKDATTSVEYFSGSFATETSKAYTFIAYDTLISGKFKGLLLSSDRSLAENNTSTAKVRYLNLSPKSPDMELWMIRRVGGVNTDSANIGSQPYLGSVATPNVTSLSNFTSIKANEVAGSAGTGSAATDYLIRLKLSTGTIVSTSAATTIIPARNYTIFARGAYPSSAVTLLLNN